MYSMANEYKYDRVLLKLSGEALAGDKHFGFDFDVVSPDRPRAWIAPRPITSACWPR